LIILGVDPGIASTGYGVIKTRDNAEALLIKCGVVTTFKEDDYEERLKQIYDGISKIIKSFSPDVVAIESIFYSKNLKSLVLVSEAIGVITLAATNYGLKVKKFTPLEVKSSITGFGKARKEQVQLMVKNILNLDENIKSNHASDALAVAICYRNLYC